MDARDRPRLRANAKNFTDGSQEYDLADAESWMVACLAYNPEYIHWGPGEDYMATTGDGWGASLEFATWDEFGPWPLDELNELVHFYFEINRASRQCGGCDGSGLNPATKKICDDFYGDGTGWRWCDAITQDETDILVQEGRCEPGTRASDLNREGGWVHDAINRWILIEARAKRLGVHGMCAECKGSGNWTESAAHLGVVLWFLVPHKGASRGVRVERIERDQLPAVLAYLRDARSRNEQRFGRLPPSTCSKVSRKRNKLGP
jgi:hypothetical protein